MNHGARDGIEGSNPDACCFFLFFSVPKQRYTITRDWEHGGLATPMLIGAVKPGAGPPPIPVRFMVSFGLGT